MTRAAVQGLLDDLRQHRLLEPPQLAELQGKEFADARALAQELLRRNWITAYQANILLQGQGAELVQGGYVLLERLGEGGTGQVFKARHRGMDRLVALKVVRKELVADAEVVGRFYREMAATSKLEHPNLVRAYDSGPLGHTHFMAMEYVEGTDLERLVRKEGKLPVAVACAYIRQAAVGLQHLHDNGLIHRDIKPSNLMVSGGQVKILDLGLARFQETFHGKTSTKLPDGKSLTNLTLDGSVTTGTIDYLSPEQALDFSRVDIRGDIYSLGCTLFFALTGRPPFGAAPLAMKLMRHQQAPPPDLARFRPDAPPALAAIVQKMLAKRPQDRYQTPAEVAEALTRLDAAPAPPRRRGRRVAALAALLLVVGIGGAVFLAGGGTRGPGGATQAALAPRPMRNEKLRDLPDNTWVKLGPFTAKARGAHEVNLVYDPDLRRLVRVGGRIPDHANEVYSLDLGVMQWTCILPASKDAPAQGPGSRPGHSSNRGACYDRDHHCLWDYCSQTLLKGVGDLTAGKWTNLPGQYKLGYDARLVYDEHAHQLVMLGKDMSSFGRTMIINPVTGAVREVAAAPGTGGRVGLANFPGFVYVPELKGSFLVGNLPDKAEGSTQRVSVQWLLDATSGTWRDLAPRGPLPPFRTGPGMSHDRQNRVVVLFGGQGANGHGLDGTWVYQPTSNTWTEMKAAGSPKPAQPRPYTQPDSQMMAYDEEHNVHVVVLQDWGDDTGVWAYRYKR